MRYIKTLPKDDYYSRKTQRPAVADEELNEIIALSSAKLYALIQNVPSSSDFNPTDVKQINTLITLVGNLITPLADNNPQKKVLQYRLNLLIELNKINQLEPIDIPQDNNQSIPYCILAESIGGVTEKLSLISLAQVKKQLGQLCNSSELTIDTYMEQQQHYKLTTEAILKLPKHGNVEEVQREAMALNISRMMGLDTTKSTTVSHNGRPALFIPFEKIDLLTHFSSGKTYTSRHGFQLQTYTHYSTINPVGDGIQADRFVTDFGNAFALLYLCSDTDAVGGYCQNKALINSKSLFVFDQVVMDEHKFILDSRLSLQPNQFFLKHTRHGQGRNRTLIEDSDMVAKYTSIMSLNTISDKIIQYATHVAWINHCRADEISASLNGTLGQQEINQLNVELSDVLALEKDALIIKTKMRERIDGIKEVLPKTSGVVSPIEIRQALILEKLIHNPVLFTDDGRPYKNPWTNRQTNTIQSINDQGNGSIRIEFKSKIPLEMVDFIKRHSADSSLTLASPRTLTISKIHLNELKEYMLHPEHALNLAPVDYLILSDLELIKNAYGNGNSTEILNAISTYRSEMNKVAGSTMEKLVSITHTEFDLIQLINTAKDKGFGMHILKKFYFDAQQQVQKLINPSHLPSGINQAFSAALKLDRISEFNKVVLKAFTKKKLTDPLFLSFLNYCIQSEIASTNHLEAQRESLNLSIESRKVLDHLNTPTVPLVVQLENSVQGTLTQTSPVIDHEHDSESKRYVPNKAPVPPPKIRENLLQESISLKG